MASSSMNSQALRPHGRDDHAPLFALTRNGAVAILLQQVGIYTQPTGQDSASKRRYKREHDRLSELAPCP
jgi:hypothetical protein